ncbi:MAG TPA: FAD-dependent oxidoreductase [Planctomycetota bacterium]|nr:FAD-dependent oxidoreductase [Planctomycetota bacterium]
MLFRTLLLSLVAVCFAARGADEVKTYDVVIVGGTPGGITAAIGAARAGYTSVILDRNSHIGGLPANGLGATDIGTRGCTGGLFLEFVNRVRNYYVEKYGPDSEQVKVCSDGYHFEPSVAEKIFTKMLSEHGKIKVLRLRQFDAKPENVVLENGRLVQITVTNLKNRELEHYSGKVFIDATYEGDLAAAAGAPWRTRREGKSEYNEPLAGRVYKAWGTPPTEVGEGSTGEGDDTIQAYNYRMCITTRDDNKVKIEKPATYNREEYVSLIDDVKLNRTPGKHRGEVAFDGIGRITNIVHLPNGKTDANNQHLAFISTDLPEENWPWPTADWAWRDKFAQRLRDYTLGLFYFAQNDPELPEEFRQKCQQWGLAKNEYKDNGNFPRQAYVREGRRIEGEYLFTAHDSLPVTKTGRPPLHASSITASHYAIDSHAIRKREPNRVHLDGFLSHATRPYTVPYGIIVPKKVDGLLTPVPVSATHLGFGTLRMEPCWMALGHAAGIAAAESIRTGLPPRKVNVDAIQRELVKQKAILIYYKDVPSTHPRHAVVQFFGLRGFLPDWEAKLDQPVSETDMKNWLAWSGVGEIKKDADAPAWTRGDLLEFLYRATQNLPPEKLEKVRAPKP